VTALNCVLERTLTVVKIGFSVWRNLRTWTSETVVVGETRGAGIVWRRCMCSRVLVSRDVLSLLHAFNCWWSTRFFWKREECESGYRGSCFEGCKFGIKTSRGLGVDESFDFLINGLCIVRVWSVVRNVLVPETSVSLFL